MCILAPIFFLPPAEIPGKEQTLLCNHPHPQKWEETPASAPWALISCLYSPCHAACLWCWALNCFHISCHAVFCLSMALIAPLVNSTPSPQWFISGFLLNGHLRPSSLWSLDTQNYWVSSWCLWVLASQLCASHRLLSQASSSHFVLLT